VCTTVSKLSYGLNKTLQMCTVKTESGLGYKSSQVRVQVQQKWTCPSPDSSTTSPPIQLHALSMHYVGDDRLMSTRMTLSRAHTSTKAADVAKFLLSNSTLQSTLRGSVSASHLTVTLRWVGITVIPTQRSVT